MSPDEENHEQTGGAREQRLRVDAARVAAARLRLAAIDRAMFTAGKKAPAESHDATFRRAVAALFDHG